MPRCLSCMRGFFHECRGGGCDSQGSDTTPESDPIPNDDEPELAEDSPRRRVRRTKPDAALKDQQSTGRKRAARLYPLPTKEEGPKPCEWRGKMRQGGGDYPIEGCLTGTQQARHHGPDKNTLNNDPGNVHRICHGCHNRWHAKNDPDYDPNKPLKS